MRKIFIGSTVLMIIIMSIYLYNDGKNNKVLIIAHRGASGYAPEHTLIAYDMALENENVDYLELDLHLTKDNYIISIHDDDVDRTTNGHGKIKELTIKDIKKLDAGSWFDKKYINEKIPTLNEILDRYGSEAKYYIEIKEKGNKKLMDELLYQLKINGLLSKSKIEKDNVIIQSFSPEDLQYINKKNRSIKLVQLVNNGFLTYCTEEDLKKIKQYADVLGPDFRELTHEKVKILHENKLEVHTYTINSKEDKTFVKSLKVDGYFTNYPD